MDLSRRALLGGTSLAAVLGATGLTGCSSSTSSSSSSTSTSTSTASASATTSDSASTGTTASASAGSITLDSKAWSYDETNDVYYQIGRSFLKSPQAPDIEKIALFVPGKYFTGTKNSDGTYTCTVNKAGKVSTFTATTAPTVFPVDTPGYAAQQPITSYSYDTVKDFMVAGLIYAHAGIRGKDTESTTYTGNAPWGVTDLKAAIRYVRNNNDVLPGDAQQIFTFGMSGGGAQSALAGATGDAAEYTPYLTALGAALTDGKGRHISDAVAGAMCWCPITSLYEMNAAYEWNMGQFASTGTRAAGTWTAQYSKDLADAFPGYLNDLGLKDDHGTILKLTRSSEGHYLAGTYYDHVVGVIQDSLNTFIANTTFPYTPSTQSQAGMSAGGSGGSGTMPSGAMPSGGTSSGSAPSGSSAGASGGTNPGSTSSQSTTTYKTLSEYITHLNSTGEWVSYDATTKKATVKNLKGFILSQKPATKSVGASDGYDRSGNENVVMGLNTTGLHFSKMSRDTIARNSAAYAKLSGWKTDYSATEYDSDFRKTDSVGKNPLQREQMYNPMFYVSRNHAGYRTSTVAPHWRIRTGIMQGDTSNTTEINLALALKNLGKDVDFATVWGLQHTTAEVTGTATANFISWVKQKARS